MKKGSKPPSQVTSVLLSGIRLVFRNPFRAGDFYSYDPQPSASLFELSVTTIYILGVLPADHADSRGYKSFDTPDSQWVLPPFRTISLH